MTEYAQLIIDSIKKELVGNYDEDMVILHSASEKYKNDEESTDILREIATMMFGILPDSEKMQLASRFEEMKSGVATDFAAVKDMIRDGDFMKAKATMESILTAVEGSYEENEDSIYMSFNHIMEMYIYHFYYKPVKEVKAADIEYNVFYRTYGFILAHLEEYEASMEAHEKAMKWNPVDLDSILSLCEVYKHNNDLDNFLKTTKQAYRYCCTRATMARFYRNVAFYYVEKYKPEVARALYAYSNIYFQTENADNELAYIAKSTDCKTPQYDLATLQQILNENDIELGPDSTTIGIIYRVGQLLMEEGDNVKAKDCFSVVYDITQDAEVRELIEKL
ncbi:hypothetical protein [[Clostridium] fimetarium]|uniref:Tetratricopeptide repeat-containing protein n=1 Tax=[Clostridium] fimetarium TaxID=99656 RepID=A0A1I0RBC2_9FIRM|nr:hypothetical protein [[Clostridium] fimetarium]SEW37895.1 hypothetical protein SAMN05421659_11388 [[Clostridium] fimetarium]